MNELNLQNPEFRRRINSVRIHRGQIVVEFITRGTDFNVGVGFIFCYGKILSNNQRWFKRNGREIITLNDLDNLKGYP